MRSFTAAEWIGWGSRRMAMIAPLPEGGDLYDPDVLKGQRVLIDGTEHEVIGVDSRNIPRGPDEPYREDFGLVVQGEGSGAA